MRLGGRSWLSDAAGRTRGLKGGLDFVCDVYVVGFQPIIQAGGREEILWGSVEGKDHQRHNWILILAFKEIYLRKLCQGILF